MNKKELFEKREKNIKHYKLENGNYLSEIHSSPIHYPDSASGGYRDCDCTLHKCGECYLSGEGDFRVKLPKNIGGDIKDIGIYRGASSIKWEYLPDRKKTFKNGRLISSDNGLKNTKAGYDSIIYPDICRNIDLVYEVDSSELKEKIIIKGKKRTYNSRFLFKLEGYSLDESIIGDRKTLIFTPAVNKEDDKVSGVFRMKELFMYDNNGSYSEAVNYRFEKISECEYIVTVEPNKAWIEAEDRRFPITIDPSIESLDSTTASIVSRTICSNGSVLSGSYRKVGFESGSTEYRTYFKITPAALPEGAKINSVSLRCEWSNYENMKVLLLYSLGGSVDIGTVTWASMPTEISSIAGRIHTGSTSFTADITSAYKSSNGILNLVLRAERNTCDSCSSVIDFNSSGLTLEIEYSVKKERKNTFDYQEYFDIDLGAAGKGKINLFNGNLLIETPTPVSDKNRKVPLHNALYNNAAQNNASTCGMKWKFPYHYSIVDDIRPGDPDIRYVKKYTDIYENNYYLYNRYIDNEYPADDINSTSGIIYYYGDNGLSYTGLSYTDLGSVFKDMKGNKYILERVDLKTSLIYLSKTGEQSKLVQNNSGLFTQLIDNIGNVYNLEYSEDKKLVSITREGSSKAIVQYTYSSGTDKKLTRVSYWNGLSVNYTYNSDNMLASVSDNFGNETRFTYVNGSLVKKIERRTTYSNISDSGQTTNNPKLLLESYTVDYHGAWTSVKDNKGVKFVYCFDDEGRAIMKYEDISESGIVRPGRVTRTKAMHYRKEISEYFKSLKELEVSNSTVVFKDLISDSDFLNVSTNDNTSMGKWYTSYNSIIHSSTSVPIPGAKSVQLSENSLKQKINLNNAALKSEIVGNMLIVSVWAKVGSLMNSTPDRGIPKLKIERKYTKRDLTDNKETTVDYPFINKDYFTAHTEEFSFDTNYSGWQYGAIAVEMNLNTVTAENVEYTLSTLNVILECGDYVCTFCNPRADNCYGTLVSNYITTEIVYYDENKLEINDDYPYPVEYDKYGVPDRARSYEIFPMLNYRMFDGRYSLVCKGDRSLNIIEEKITDLAGNNYITRYGYDKDNRMIYKTDYKGVTTGYEYDEYGQLCKERYGADIIRTTGANNEESITFANSVDFEYIYSYKDSFLGADIWNAGNLWKMTDFSGNTTEYFYDDYNRVKKIREGNGNEREFRYNTNGEMKEVFTSVSGTTNKNSLEYRTGMNTVLSDNTSKYKYTYDGHRRVTLVKDNNTALETYTYNDTLGNGNTSVTTKIGSNSFTVTKNSDGKPISLKQGSTVLCEAVYDENGKVTNVTDNVRNAKLEFNYDKHGYPANERVIFKNSSGVWQDKGSGSNFVEYEYDENIPGRLNFMTYKEIDDVTGYSQKYKIEYNDYGNKPSLDNEIKAIKGVVYNYPQYVTVFSSEVEKDRYSRITNKRVKSGENQLVYNTEYEYRPGKLQPLSEKKTYRDGLMNTGIIEYVYDGSGNILRATEAELKTISSGGGTTINERIPISENIFEYDKAGRLTRDCSLNDCYYMYDASGNILSKTVYQKSSGNSSGRLDKTEEYVYNGNGELASRKISKSNPENCCNDTAIDYFVYNNNGYPTTYKGYTLTWSALNNLTSYKDETFRYDVNGVRTHKNEIVYTYDGNKLIKERQGNKYIRYQYGVDGIIGFTSSRYPNKRYYYEKNIMGDVTGILDETGLCIARYRYEAFGEHKVYDAEGNINTDVTFIGNENSIRYRGMYYDVETGLYYDGQRYYDPEIARYVSPKKLNEMRSDVINGLNLYSFRRNSPNRPKVVSIANNGAKRLSPELSLPDIPISSSDEIHYTLGAPDENLLNMQLFGEILQLSASTVGFVSENIKLVDKSISKGLIWTGRILGVADVLLQIGVSAYNHFNNESLSTKEKLIAVSEDFLFDIVPSLVANCIVSATIGKAIGAAMATCPPLLTVAVTTVAVVAVTAILVAILNNVIEECRWRENYKATVEAYV